MSDERIENVYVTPYALTAGVQLRECEICGDDLSMARFSWSEGFYGEGKDWHRSWESALRRAESMRDRKIASLRKQLAKLEAMTFAEPGEVMKRTAFGGAT